MCMHIYTGMCVRVRVCVSVCVRVRMRVRSRVRAHVSEDTGTSRVRD